MNSKPKILFIMHMPPPVHGAAMMGQWIHDSKYINDCFECLYINPTQSVDIQTIGEKSIKKYFSGFIFIIKLILKVLSEKPDLCYYTATAGTKTCVRDALIVSFLNFMKKKVVLHPHNRGFRWRIEQNFTSKLMYPIVFKNSKVILISEKLFDDISLVVKKEQVLFCPNGCPESIDYEPNAVRNNAVPRLLFLSNMIETKGVLVLLDALRILKDKGMPFCCDFVGAETPSIDQFRFNQEVIKRNLSDEVVFHGKKYGKEKHLFFQNADVFLFPTFYPGETFGLVNLEAMEFKLPVVTTDIGGVTDAVIDNFNGLICEKENPKSLAEAIETLLKNKDRRQKMGENGYKLYKDQFTFSCFEKRFVDCLEKCLAE